MFILIKAYYILLRVMKQEVGDLNIHSLLKEIKTTLRDYIKYQSKNQSRDQSKMLKLKRKVKKHLENSSQLIILIINSNSVERMLKKHLYALLLQLKKPQMIVQQWQNMSAVKPSLYTLLKTDQKHLIAETVQNSVKIIHQLNSLKSSLKNIPFDAKISHECPDYIGVSYLIKMLLDDRRIDFSTGFNELMFKIVIIQESIRLILQKTLKILSKTTQDKSEETNQDLDSVQSEELQKQLPNTNKKTLYQSIAISKSRQKPFSSLNSQYRMLPKKQKKASKLDRYLTCCF